jgi:hypothetical protein
MDPFYVGPSQFSMLQWWKVGQGNKDNDLAKAFITAQYSIPIPKHDIDSIVIQKSNSGGIPW